MTRTLWTFAGLVAAGLLIVPAARAEVPQGPYLQSCSDVRVQGSVLIASCERANGGYRVSLLEDAKACSGVIANVDGWLHCTPGRTSGP